MTIFAVATISVLTALVLAVARLLMGPSIFDRVVAGNTVGSLSVLILALIGFVFGRPEFLDLAITYALLNVIGTIAVLKYFRYGNLGRADENGDS
ncbi:MAG TPA: pH regulation protein F [Rhodospirillaceae bacterium]|nr:pH regulation protein F [Candidatus Neomarinimicrobiota bacterium]HCX14626.1 pH regulation protein F [Rhodospirillaceae bacterium]